MEKSLINEINRQRQIMGLNPILIKEDTGFGSIGEFFANAIKSLSKETGLFDDAGKAIVKIGDDLNLTSKQFDELILNIRNGNYASISDEALDAIATLIRRGSNEEGVKYIDTLMNKVDESLKEINPNSSIDEWVDITAKNAERGLRTIDESIDALTNNNPLLKKVLKDSLESKVNTAIGLIRKTAQDASDAASKAAAEEAERLSKRETGTLVQRIRARNPNALRNFDDEVGWKFLYTWRYSPLTKMTQWFDLGKLIESMYLIRGNRDDLLNTMLDDFESLSANIFQSKNVGKDFGFWLDQYSEKINLMMQQLSAWKPMNEQYDQIVEELVNMYSRNPELDTLGKEVKDQFIEEFRDLLKYSNPATPDYPTFAYSLYLSIKNFKNKSLVDLGDVLKRIETETAKKKGFLAGVGKVGGFFGDLFKALLLKIEQHAFTGRFMNAKEWSELMDSRPYLIPLFRRVPTSNPYNPFNYYLGKYAYWWGWNKITVPAVWAMIQGFYEMAMVGAGKAEAYPESMSNWDAIWNRFIVKFFDNLLDGFTVEVKTNVENPDLQSGLIEDAERQFSLVKTILPVSFNIIITWDAISNTIKGKYQDIFYNWLKDKKNEAVEAVEEATGEARQTGMEIIDRLDSTAQEIRVPEEPEIDSTLLRQQEGPVVTGPSDGRGDVIDAYNIGNPNDKVTNYNPNTGEATYKGKKGKIARGANGDLLFISDDYQTVKNFGQ